MRGNTLSPNRSLAASFQQDLLAERTGIKSKSRPSRSPNLSPCECLCCLLYSTLKRKEDLESGSFSLTINFTVFSKSFQNIFCLSLLTFGSFVDPGRIIC